MPQRPLLKTIHFEDKEIIINYLQSNKTTTVKNKILLSSLNLDISKYRKLEDMLKYLEKTECLLISKKLGRANVWKLLNKDIITRKISEVNDLQSAIDFSQDGFDEDTIEFLKKLFISNSKTILGKFAISENINDKKMHNIYDELSQAIKQRYYLIIHFLYEDACYEVKPIRLVFMDNNWYIAFEYKDNNNNKFRFARLSFIKNIEYLKDSKYSNKNTFQEKDLSKYIDFVDNAQNSMSLYDTKRHTAKIKATPQIAKYFEKNMKKFLNSQKFEKKQDDGSIIFTIRYTQELEILPFIQKWMPQLIILEPKELAQSYIQKLQDAIRNLNNEIL